MDMVNYGFTRCAIANFNCELGNPREAAEKIIEISKEAAAKGVKVLIFPELCMTGYTCEDLFFNDRLIEATFSSLNKIISFSLSEDILIVVGVVLMLIEVITGEINEFKSRRK